MNEKSGKLQFKMVKVTESLNGRIIALQCQSLRPDQYYQISLIKVINLVGEWPQSPIIFKRKNYPTLIELIRFNKTKKQTSEFIKEVIRDLTKFQTIQLLLSLSVQQSKIIPSEIFVSNSGQRVSFWLSQDNFLFIFNTLAKLGYLSFLNDFQWIDILLEKVDLNQIQYGSQNFINLIQRFSLQSMTGLINMEDYSQMEFKQISQSFHSVFSLVNYNYRYFFPPKDATRFLKKTSGITLVSKTPLPQQKSNKWAEQVLLQSILELRPTYVLAQIFSRSQGPLYLQKYVFTQKFYFSIEEIYFLGKIQNYFIEANLRNDLKYLTFVSRIYPEYLKLKQIQSKIQKLKQSGQLEDYQQLHLLINKKNQDEEFQEDSEQQDAKNVNNKQQNDIKNLYKNSQEYVKKIFKKELSQTISLLKQKQSLQNSLDQIQSQQVKLCLQIQSLRQSCQHVGISFCISCGFSTTRISTDQKNLNEFLTMFNEGSNKFCLSCADLSIKDKIISGKNRIRNETNDPYVVMKNKQDDSIYIVPAQLKDQFKPQNTEKKQFQSQQTLMMKKEKDILINDSNSNLTQSQSKPQILQKTQTSSLPSSQKTLQSKKNEPKFNSKNVSQISEQNSQKINLKFQQQQQLKQTKDERQQKNRTKNESFKQSKQKLMQKYYQQKTIKLQMNRERGILVSQKYLIGWGLMSLRLNNQATEPISAQLMHDTLQLSILSGQLTTSEYVSNDLLDIYQYYFESMTVYLRRVSTPIQNYFNLIPYIQRNITALHQRRYMKVEANVFQTVFSKTLKTSKDQVKLFSVQKQQQFFTNNLYAFLEVKLQAYKAQISQHYKTYKSVMNQQYKVTEIELKQMIVNFQQDLKNSIVKTTQNFLLTSRWIIIFISEYVEFKTIEIKKNQILAEDMNYVAYFMNQIQFLLNLIATFVNVFNQPGQIKIIEQAQIQILNIILVLVQNEKLLQKQTNLSFQMDMQVIEILITDMLDHFVAKKGSSATQDAKKLTNRHFTKLKSILQTKLKALTVKRILNFHQQIKLQQKDIVSQTLMTVANKDINIIKDLYVNGSLNSTPGYFSSLVYLEKQFQKNLSSFHNNNQIISHIALLGFAMERCINNQKQLALRSKSEPQYQIRFGILYKLILQSLQKPQQAAQLLKVYQSGNKILIDLINYLISVFLQIAFKSLQNQQIAQTVKLYIQRVRHRLIKYTAKTIKHYDETLQIFEFLFKNRNLFFNIQNKIKFEIQFHMIIQIVILNSLPLYNIQLAYKSQMKEINKQLNHFDVNDHYNEIEDYYLKVVSHRHDKAKQKRKKEIANKKEKI